MNELFRAVSQRLKTIFTVHAALELEAELILSHAERKAALLLRAAQLEKEGMTDLAAEMRCHTGAMDLGRMESAPALPGPDPSGVTSEDANNREVEPSTTGRKKTR